MIQVHKNEDGDEKDKSRPLDTEILEHFRALYKQLVYVNKSINDQVTLSQILCQGLNFKLFLQGILSMILTRDKVYSYNMDLGALWAETGWLRFCLQCGRPGFNPWVRKIPWRREWLTTPVLLPGESHGQRSLVGYSPGGLKELDTTE